MEEARAEINEFANENDQLKIAVAKARYLVLPPAGETSVEEKRQINLLRIENEELKNEVRLKTAKPR